MCDKEHAVHSKTLQGIIMFLKLHFYSISIGRIVEIIYLLIVLID